MRESQPPYPWLRLYGHVPARLDFPRITLYQPVTAAARRPPDRPPSEFPSTSAGYRELARAIDRLAAALAAPGMWAGHRGHARAWRRGRVP
jgi:hypothetical protein